MPADPFSCAGGHVGTAAPGAVLPVRGFGARGGFAVRYRVAALFAAYGAAAGEGCRPAGRLCWAGGCPVAWGRLRGVHRPVMGAGFRRWGEREANAALAAVFVPDGRKVRLRVRAGRSFAPCVPQLSGRMSAARSCVPQLRPETQRPGDPYVRSPGRRSGSAVRYFSAGFR